MIPAEHGRHRDGSFLVSDVILDVSGVSFGYGRRAALRDVSFTAPSGQVTMLLGPNGAGKTTLFSLIARLLPLQGGRISICGQDLASSPSDILSAVGIVCQQQTVDLDLTVEQNLRYYAALHGVEQREADRRIAAALERLELAERRREKVRILNGGHRRRTEIARALLTEPRLMLLDEPTVGLDIPTRRALVSFLHELVTHQDLAILWATHLSDEVAPSDHVVILSNGEVKGKGVCTALAAQCGAATLDDAFNRLTAEVVHEG